MGVEADVARALVVVSPLIFPYLCLQCFIEALALEWTPVQRKLLFKAFRSPTKYPDILKNMEGVSAGSLHPGDWRFKDFDYE